MPTDRYRQPLTFYPTPALRSAIEQRAKTERRSLSQVVQFALEHAFQIDPEPIDEPKPAEAKAPVKLQLRPRA